MPVVLVAYVASSVERSGPARTYLGCFQKLDHQYLQESSIPHYIDQSHKSESPFLPCLPFSHRHLDVEDPILTKVAFHIKKTVLLWQLGNIQLPFSPGSSYSLQQPKYDHYWGPRTRTVKNLTRVQETWDLIAFPRHDCSE